jgi:dienelactone hydrolase
MKTSRLLTLAGLLSAAPLTAQQGAGGTRPLTVADFDQWRSIQGETLSPDGRWAAYSLVPQVGEGEVVVRALPSGPEYRHTRGYIGRPETRPGAERATGFRAPPAEITADSRWVVFTIAPAREAVERARRQRRRGAEPKGALGILSLADGKVTTLPGVKSFRLPEKSGRWVAYLLEKDSTPAARPDSTAPGAAAAATPGGEARPISADTARPAKKETGATLVLRELATGAEVRIADVTGYTFDERGGWLGYTVSSRDGARDGAYVRGLADGRTHALLTGEGSYRGLVFDEAGTQAAFLSDRDTRGKEKRHAVYHASLRAPAARRAVPSTELPGGWIVSEKGTLRFAEGGRILHFGVAPPPLDSIPADSLADKAVFDLWHWQDPRLQPQQHVEASRDRERAYAAVYQPGTGRYRVLGNDTLREVRFSEDGRVGVANATLPYAVSAMWGENGNDVYVIDAVSGARRLVKRNVPFAATVSPGGRYVLFFDRDRRWHAYEVASGRTRDLTGALGVRFDQETWDTPSDPAPWGVAGWTEGDRSVLVYDRYDVWEVDPAGRRPARVVTDSAGRRGKLIFRVVDLDREEEWIDPAAPLLLRAVDDESKATGFWRDRLGTAAPPARLVMEDRQLGVPLKAEEAEVYLFTRSTVREFPDLWVSGPELTGAVRVSEANPQQARYRWATAELVRWRSADGVELKGLLYRPEGFDPSRKHPMVVYFYEQLSDELHRYRMDVPRNTIQPTLYASQGYLVFIPDIHYTDGYPGESALKSIVPGVQSLIARGFVDPTMVGIQGQSWGGYQTAYIITRTPLFRAAMAGAPVANMTSAYGGIRWESGLARAFQYEVGQSRIGGSLWERPWRYIENSPLFAADRVTTPLLIMHNDADGAVPWEQGIEMFVALRRLGKEVYLVNYNGDAHNPTKRANQLDVAARMLQFFDHHLKGAPAPEWMRRGVPFLQKGRDQVVAQPAEVPVTTAPAPEPGGERRP